MGSEDILAIEGTLKLITENPARNMKIRNKGAIAVGYDADFVFMDENLTITDVIANGVLMMQENMML